MIAEHVHGKNIILKHEIAFPIFKSELMENKGDSPTIWIRNGIALTKEGEIKRSGIVTYDMELIA